MTKEEFIFKHKTGAYPESIIASDLDLLLSTPPDAAEWPSEISVKEKAAYPTGHSQSGVGISQRTLIAAMAMQGILANSAVFMADDAHKAAKRALECADELLKQLEK